MPLSCQEASGNFPNHPAPQFPHVQSGDVKPTIVVRIKYADEWSLEFGSQWDSRGIFSPLAFGGSIGQVASTLAKAWVPLLTARGEYLAQCTVGSERNDVSEWGGFFWKFGKHN